MPHPAVFGSKHFARQLAARRPLRSTNAPRRSHRPHRPCRPRPRLRTRGDAV